MLTALLVVAVLGTVQAAVFLALVVRGVLKLPRLEALSPLAPARWPPVSLLVPARVREVAGNEVPGGGAARGQPVPLPVAGVRQGRVA